MNKTKLVQGGDGTAIPAGFVGEVKSANTTTATASGVNSTAVICSLSLEAGSWDLFAVCGIYNGTRPTTNAVACGVDLYNSTGAASIAVASLLGYWGSASNDLDSPYANGAICSHVVLTETSTIQYRIRCDDITGATGTPTAVSRNTGVFKAVRRA